MKRIIGAALGVVLAATAAAPATAQATYGYEPNGRANAVMQQVVGSSPGQQSAPQRAPATTKSQQQQGGIQPSKKAMKSLLELQDAVNKNDGANIPAKIATAQAVATTKEDRYLIAELQLKAALAAKNVGSIAAAIDAVVASGYNDGKTNAGLYESLGASYMDSKQYPEAVAAFQRAAAADPGAWLANAMVGEALYVDGKKDEAVAAFQRAVRIARAEGTKPDENLYKRAVGMAYESKSPAAIGLALEWAAAFPTPSSWSDAIAIYRSYNLSDNEATIDLLRLKQAMGTLTPGEYGLLAQTAADQLVVGEARSVIDAGIAAKKIDPADPQFQNLIGALKTRAKPTSADLATAMKAAANARALMRIGDNYAALGDYSSAVQAYKLSMTKPDGDAALASLHIGIALAQSGDKAGATAALNSVTGPRAGIAKYWLAYLAQKA